MAEYEFECRTCKRVFTAFMRTGDRIFRCPGCGSGDVEALTQPFVAKTSRKD